MAFVGEAILSSFFDTLFDKLSSVLIDYARQVQVHAELNKWKKTLNKIHAVLEDAEEKQVENQVVKIWLDDLRDLAYDVEDILDELATEAFGRKLMAETQASTSKFRSLIPSCCTSFTPSAIKFNVEMRSKIENITERLQDISSEQNNLLLTKKVSGKSSAKPRETSSLVDESRETSSVVDESRVYGRKTDKEAILNLLLHDHEPSDDAVHVIPIIGMGGVGKTTLAQLAYNDHKVKSHFDQTVWACVSDDFDVLSVTKKILQAVAPDMPNVNDLNQLQVKLKEKLSGTKFLLVLDDVWNQNCNKWDTLYAPMRTGAQGSRVIVTTRNRGVVSAIGASSAYRLKELSNDDCLSLFAQQALGTRNFHNHPHLRVVGEKIVEKCKGLPLAAMALGGMLRQKLNRDAWEDILKSKIWDLPDQYNNTILPALHLSYHHLPSRLKCCFAYCSIFPKDYEFDVDELVLLWMGEGFLHQVKRQKQMEEIGTEFFHELFARSFFQQSNHSSSQFVMHDLVHDLAQFVAGGVCFNLEEKIENNQQHTISERARHSCFTQRVLEEAGKFKAFDTAKNLRTLIALPNMYTGGYISNQVVVHDLIMRMRRLRVLSLVGYRMGEVPSLIGELIHLRYLNFSKSDIQSLPNSVSHLYNLQTLILRRCHQLTELPTGIGKLKNLRHLDITGTRQLQEMPFQLSNLTNLQVLTRFIVSKSRGVGIEELKNCSNLQGVLSISGLQVVVDVGEARAANLKYKKKIEELTMQWSNDCWNERNDKCELRVLESLQPHENLRRLTIEFYGGSKFPSWLEDPSFSVMVELTLKNCKNCTLLPNLGGLSVLKVLCIEGMSQVKSIGAEFYGESMNPFASLKELTFEDMPEWESWSHSIFIKEDVGTFPHLEMFLIRKCPKLIGELPKCLQSLVELEVSECPGLMCGLPKLASLRQLNLKECDEAVLGGAQFDLPSLVAVNLIEISRLTCLRTGFTRSLVALQGLQIRSCDGLTCLWEEQWLPCNLKILMITNCANLEKLSNGLQTLTCLEEISISFCPKLESFPDSGFPPMLRRLELFHCEGLKSLPHNYNSCPLEVLTIECSPFLKCFPNGELPTTLKKLHIRDCQSLESQPEGLMHHNSTSSSNTRCLEELRIENCSSLNSFPTGELPSTLKRLIIVGCTNLESVSEKMSPNSTALVHLRLEQYPNLKSLQGRGLSIPNLECLEIKRCENLKSLPHQMRNLKSLRSLTISECPGLESFPEEGLAPNLTSLEIDNCKNLKTPISEWGLDTLTSLSYLTIGNMFPNMVSFPDEECLLPISLISLRIKGMESLASLDHHKLISLRSLDISNCPNLRSLGPLLARLTELVIVHCPTIKENWSNFAHIPSVRIALVHLLLEQYPNLKSLQGFLDSLRELSINDCGGVECFPERGLSIPNLEWLEIERCENLKSLTHQMRNLKSLRSLTISERPGLESFSEEGLASNLISLVIGDCKNLKTPISEWGLDTLTSLSYLTIRNMFPNMVSFPDEECLLPISLTDLQIILMKSLASLDLHKLISLRSLDISNCPNLRSLVLLPATLAELYIFGCPTIKERYLNEGGEYWSNVAHIPRISRGGVIR